MSKRSNKLALDADGVLLDYNKTAARVWEREFNVKLVPKDLGAYHFKNQYHGIDMEAPGHRERFRARFAREGWNSMDALPGVQEACELLVEHGFELHVVTSMPLEYEALRFENLKNLGLPITSVTGTGSHPYLNPKAQALAKLAPVAFVDDLLKNFQNVDGVHLAYLHWDAHDSPNLHQPHLKSLIHSEHMDLLSFAQYWVREPEYGMTL